MGVTSTFVGEGATVAADRERAGPAGHPLEVLIGQAGNLVVVRCDDAVLDCRLDEARLSSQQALCETRHTDRTI
jgi:hypothetical protein